MKEINGFKNKGGMILNKKLEIQDEQIIKMFSKKGLIKFTYMLRRNIRDRKLNKMIYYPAEQVLDGIQARIDRINLRR